MGKGLWALLHVFSLQCASTGGVGGVLWDHNAEQQEPHTCFPQQPVTGIMTQIFSTEGRACPLLSGVHITQEAGEIVLAKVNDKTHRQLFMERKTKSQSTIMEKLPKILRE